MPTHKQTAAFTCTHTHKPAHLYTCLHMPTHIHAKTHTNTHTQDRHMQTHACSMTTQTDRHTTEYTHACTHGCMHLLKNLNICSSDNQTARQMDSHTLKNSSLYYRQIKYIGRLGTIFHCLIGSLNPSSVINLCPKK